MQKNSAARTADGLNKFFMLIAFLLCVITMTAPWPRNKVRASRQDCRYTGALIAIPKEKLRNSRDGAQS
jgi:hypothetical protein